MKTLRALTIALIAGLLGTWAGADGTSKGFRRVGLPVLLILASYHIIGVWSILYAILFAPLCCGYGRFDINDDKPSTIGLWAYKICPDNAVVQDIIIRFTVGLLCWVSLCPIVIFKTGNWVVYGVLGAIYLTSEVLFGACLENEGMVKIFGKHLLLEEFYRFFVLGGTAYLLILI